MSYVSRLATWQGEGKKRDVR